MDLSPIVAAFILGVESQVWQFQGNKERLVREHLNVTMTRYMQLLNALIDSELALQIDSVTTNRLRNIRSARQHFRSARLSAS